VQGELNALKEQQQEMWAQHQEATTAADSAKSALAAAQRQVAVLEAQVVPLQREREGLTRLVDVLQKGLADQAGAHITSSSSSQPQSTAAGDASDAVVAGVTSERIQLLEQAVKDLTSQQELLQEQYKAAGQAEAQQRQRADAAERASAALERQVEALSQQCAQQQVGSRHQWFRCIGAYCRHHGQDTTLCNAA
jgi:chromosome segregation ATPase